MYKSLATALAVGLFLATLLVTGCGGDDNAGGSASTGGNTTAASVDTDGSSSDAEGDSDPDSNPASSGSGANEADISKKAFLRKAEAICRDVSLKAQGQMAAMFKSLSDPEKALKEVIDRADEVVNNILAPLYREEIDRIRALGYPRGDETEVEAMLIALEDVIQRAEAEPDKFARLNTVEGEPGNPYQRADDLARKYGFDVCPRV